MYKPCKEMDIRNVSVTPIWPCLNSTLKVYCDKSLHEHWTCKTDFRCKQRARYIISESAWNPLTTGTHAASTEQTTKHWRTSDFKLWVSVVISNRVSIFNISISNYTCCVTRCFVIIILENISFIPQATPSWTFTISKVAKKQGNDMAIL